MTVANRSTDYDAEYPHKNLPEPTVAPSPRSGAFEMDTFIARAG